MKSKNLITLFFLTLMINAWSQFPQFQWVKQIGGPGHLDYGIAVAVDASGNVYTTGHFDNTVDFDSGPGTFSVTSNGFQDVFISKTDSAGNFIWTKTIGGNGTERGLSITVDVSGNVYVSGDFTSSTDFDPGPGVLPISATGSGSINDAFVLKLDASGNFGWVKTYGSGLNEYPYAIVVDAASNVYIAGMYNDNTSFTMGTLVVPPSFSQSPNGNSKDVLIAKINAAGNFVWVRNIGAGKDDEAFSMAIDKAANLYITGVFEGVVGFLPGPGSTVLSSPGPFPDAFVLKMDSAGNCIWVKQMGGTLADRGVGISLDSAQNVHVTGLFHLTADLDPGPSIFTVTSAGAEDVFVLTLSSSGNFIWGKSIGGATTETVHAIASDFAGNVYVSGTISGTGTADFDPGPGTVNLSGPSFGSHHFLLKLDQAGNFSDAAITGSGINGSDICTDNLGNVYVTGNFRSNFDFNPGPGTSTCLPSGGSDIFTLKLGSKKKVENLTAISEQFEHAALSIYPNPVETKLQVMLTGPDSIGSLEILNILGEVLWKQSLSLKSYEIDVSNFPSGTYILKLQNKQEVLAVQKFLKY